MKEKIKQLLAEIVYRLYQCGLFKNKIKVMSIDETLDELLTSEMSLVRFGDGEIVMIKGRNLKLQMAEPEIADGLRRILGYENEGLMVSVQGIFDGVEKYQKKSRLFWKDHLLFCRNIYSKYCNPNRVYCDTAVTRCYYAFQDKTPCGGWFEKFRKVWKDKEIVVVEGARSHNGVGNNLFDNAKSVERIICPPSNAYLSKNKIIEACRKFPKSKLILLSVGVTAKFLAEELFADGYRVIDIGNLDMEYEWFLAGSLVKTKLKKHEITGEKANREAGYEEYLSQISETVDK